jgi:hypothetical protein
MQMEDLQTAEVDRWILESLSTLTRPGKQGSASPVPLYAMKVFSEEQLPNLLSFSLDRSDCIVAKCLRCLRMLADLDLSGTLVICPPAVANEASEIRSVN